jgi:tetratricopeptide (TPR) repeat protein
MSPTLPTHHSPTATSPIAALSTERSTKNSAFFRTVANLGIQTAEALEHAHQMGVVHRDIKPGNLLLDTRGNLWVTDFGLAQFQTGVELTMTGDLVGTLRYMSPEQALANRVVIDHRTDIYSLGVTLYELLTLEPAVSGKDRQELLRQIAFEDPRPLRRVNKSIPEELETIVLKAMEKNAVERYATAAEMAEDLRSFLRHEPIRAKKPTLLQRAGKWSRRHPAVVRSAMVVALLIAAGSAVSAGLIWQEKNRTGLALKAEAAERDRAEEERRVAQEREAETKAVLDFVENKIFAAARPEGHEGGLGHEVKLRKAIEAALPFVDKSFTDQPLIEARLRLSIGLAFMDLGDHRTAEKLFERARDLYSQNRGSEALETLNAMHTLARSYYNLGWNAEAAKLIEETLAQRRAKPGPDHRDTLASMALRAINQPLAEGVKLCEQTLALRKAKLGPHDPDTLMSMQQLANFYQGLGRQAEAMTVREQTLALQKAELGPDHPNTLGSMHNLAVSYSVLGRHADALKLFQKAWELQKAKLGPDHPSTLLTMSAVASTYYQLGRHAEARMLHEETLILMQAKLGPDHPNTLRTMMSVAWYCVHAGRTAEADKLCEEALALIKAKPSLAHRSTLMEMCATTRAYFSKGGYTESVRLAAEALAIQRATIGPDDADTLLVMRDEAYGYYAIGRHAEALKLAEETLTRYTAKLGPERVETLHAMSNLARIYEGVGRHAEAAKLSQRVDETYEKIKGSVAPDGFVNIACLRALAPAALRTTDPTPAGAALAEAEADQAMVWLTRAVDAGFIDVESIKKNDELKALRGREDFKKLVAELEAKAKARKKSEK